MSGLRLTRVAILLAGGLLVLAPSLPPGGQDAGILAGSSRLALALLGWSALASLPSGGATERSTRFAFLAASVPLLALAATLDRASGIPIGPTVRTAASVLLVGVPWVVSALVADDGGPRAARVHGALWTALVAGAPFFALVLASAAPEESGNLRWLARLGPVGLAWERVRASGVAGVPWTAFGTSLGVAFTVVGLASRPSAPERPPASPPASSSEGG